MPKPRPIAPKGRAKSRAIAGHLKPAEISATDRSGLDARAVEKVSEDDRCWFAANPAANWRLRRLVPGELPGHPAARWMLVNQVRPGLRLRAPLDLDIDEETAAFMTRRGYFEWVDGRPVWFPGATLAAQ